MRKLISFKIFVFTFYIIFCSVNLSASERIIFIDKNSDEADFYKRLLNNVHEKNICLITNQSGIGKYLFIPSLKSYPSYFHEVLGKYGIKLLKIFSPEHGLSSQSESTGLSTDSILTGNFIVYPAYHKTFRELQVMYDGCEAILFDLPDAGIRSYTYRTIMTRTIEAINVMKKQPVLYLLDKPNPASIYTPLAPMVNDEYFSYLGEENIPFFPFFTYAELMRYFISKKKINIDIKYIAMMHYRSGVDVIGKSINPPSPSLPHARALQCYWIGIFFEGTTLDYGKYTKDPFCLIGHPDINYKSDPPQIQGIVFKKYVYKPFAGPYQGVLMRGYEMNITDIYKVQPVKAAYTILEYFYREYPGIKLFTPGNPHYHIDRILGGNSFRSSIEKKVSYKKWESGERKKINKFIYEMENFKMY
ncbi:MAG: DUF1343 domain-containing protein [Spirochaetia bacterium]|nr:DUF1343 domain-containing protein [Spirochaetia bacterium]